MQHYPFTLMTGRLIFHYHSRTQTDRAARWTTRCPSPTCRSIRRMQRDWASRTARRSSCAAGVAKSTPLAAVTDDVAPGVLYMTMHFDPGVNNLTNTALDPLSKMPELKHCAVAVEKIAGVN